MKKNLTLFLNTIHFYRILNTLDHFTIFNLSNKCGIHLISKKIILLKIIFKNEKIQHDILIK